MQRGRSWKQFLYFLYFLNLIAVVFIDATLSGLFRNFLVLDLYFLAFRGHKLSSSAVMDWYPHWCNACTNECGAP